MAHRVRRTAVALVTALLCLGLLVPMLSVTAAPGGGAGRDEAFIRKVIKGMTIEEKVGQMFMTYAYGQSADDPDPAMVAANQDAYGLDNFEQLIDEYHLGGIIYFAWSNNVNNPVQIAGLSNGIQDSALSQPSGVPLLVSTDQEQGVVVRVGPPATQFPGNMALWRGARGIECPYGRRDHRERAPGHRDQRELRSGGGRECQRSEPRHRSPLVRVRSSTRIEAQRRAGQGLSVPRRVVDRKAFPGTR
jgi:hypothetical protein